MKLVFATHNQGKVKEMRAMLASLSIDVVSMDEAGVRGEAVENGKTFEENALKKARDVAKQTGQWALGEDSGICIEALGCAPGIYSARWAGEGATDVQIVEHTLQQMKHVSREKRQAWFETALALVAPDGREWIFYGKVDGRVSVESRGTPRPKLAYDMIFIPDGYERTFAEMPDEEKNSLSHRGRAFTEFKKFIATLS